MFTRISDTRPRCLETLVLDDDSHWRQLVALNLETRLGTMPFLAADGKEALEIMSERPIDVVICDLQMPGMDGLQFLEKARKECSRTQVILVSGDFKSFPTPTRELIDKGALATIPKTEICSTLIDVLQVLQEMPEQRAQMRDWCTRTYKEWFSVN